MTGRVRVCVPCACACMSFWVQLSVGGQHANSVIPQARGGVACSPLAARSLARSLACRLSRLARRFLVPYPLASIPTRPVPGARECTRDHETPLHARACARAALLALDAPTLPSQCTHAFAASRMRLVCRGGGGGRRDRHAHGQKAHSVPRHWPGAPCSTCEHAAASSPSLIHKTARTRDEAGAACCGLVQGLVKGLGLLAAVLWMRLGLLAAV